MNERVIRTRGAKARGAAKKELGTRVTTQSRYGEEAVEQEEIEERTFPPGVEPAFVRVGVGRTYNLGDFNSLRLDVHVSLPCLPNMKDVEDTYKRASDYVADKLHEEEGMWLGSSGKQSSKKR